jgi:hypothetical protein
MDINLYLHIAFENVHTCQTVLANDGVDGLRENRFNGFNGFNGIHRFRRAVCTTAIATFDDCP